MKMGRLTIMKNKILTVALGVFLAATLSGCSSELSNEYITIKQYEGLEVPQVEQVEVTEDQILNRIDYYLNADAVKKEVTDRAAKEGDTVDIDFVGKVDGAEFEGGAASGQELELGSGRFIGANGDYKGFEEQIEGHEAGESFDIEVKFPDSYTEELAGKVAVFSIKLNHIYEVSVPELTDDWVKENSIESKNVKSYKEEIQDQIQNTELWMSTLTALVDQVEVKKFPEGEVEEQQTTITDYYQQMASAYGVEFEEFLSSYLGMTEEEFQEEAKKLAEDAIKQQLAVELLAEKKKQEISDDEYEIGLKRYAAAAGYTNDSIEEYEEKYGKELIQDSLLQEKVAKYLAKSCVQVEQDTTAE